MRAGEAETTGCICCGLFFLLPEKVQPARQNCRQHHAIPPPAKKSDKNLHPPKNLVYYICKREGQKPSET